MLVADLDSGRRHRLLWPRHRNDRRACGQGRPKHCWQACDDRRLPYRTRAAPSGGNRRFCFRSFRPRPNVREATTLIGAVALFVAILLMLSGVLGRRRRPALHHCRYSARSLDCFLRRASRHAVRHVASGLWIVNSLYSIGYMRAEQAPRQTSFYVCFAVAIAAAMGIAFAGNLFTLFLFYEMLTLVDLSAGHPPGNAGGDEGGAAYLLMLLGASTGFCFCRRSPGPGLSPERSISRRAASWQATSATAPWRRFSACSCSARRKRR